MGVVGEVADIDESLYSRQLYVFGHEAQRRMACAKILFVGMDGLGLETAKNVILAGVQAVTILDPTPVSWMDLSAHFYATPEHIDQGVSRASAAVPRLAELNQYVRVHQAADPAVGVSLIDHVKGLLGEGEEHSVLVCCGQSAEFLEALSVTCREKKVAFLEGDVRGLTGQLFVDLGDSFEVSDVDGEVIPTSLVASITQDENAVVSVLEDTRHGLSTGDVVRLTDLIGCEELNNQLFTVEVKDAHTFTIGVDTRNLSLYSRSGYVNQVKQPKSISFESYLTSRAAPGMFCCDVVKYDRAVMLHLAYQVLHEFISTHGQAPRPGHEADAQTFFDLVINYTTRSPAVTEVSKAEVEGAELLLKAFARSSRGVLAPVCALVGGILGQEVLKAVSGKFMPIHQWYYYDALEALGDDISKFPTDVTPMNCRYDGQLVVFGHEYQRRLSSLNTFLVGAGAIGCEMLKNFAMMGISAGFDGNSADAKVGETTVTDMDSIEKSNLSRQFLFRSSDINHMKSKTALRAVQQMNPMFRGVSHELKVAAETESVFDDSFYESMDLIVTALDNVEARLYIDKKCLFHRLPMFESGTLGTKGHTQVVLPGKTAHYGATRDPPEKSIPVCTLKHFPNQIEHTLQWARDWFEEMFKQTFEDVNAYLTQANYLQSLEALPNIRVETLKRLRDSLVEGRPETTSDCIKWARKQFEELFHNRPLQLLHNFPLDRITSEGIPFWSGSKKPPVTVDFDVNDDLHMQFILSVANLRAMVYGLQPVEDVDSAMEICLQTNVQKFAPQEGLKIAATDEEAKQEREAAGAAHEVDAIAKEIIASLPSPQSLTGFKVQSIDFDKDTDSHMRVVAAASNLRARNYQIPEADLHKSRGIAGKITPAIATTTALVTGAICVEMYKYITGVPVDKHANTFANLAIPLFTTVEPDPPAKTETLKKGEKWSWTHWDRFEIDSPDMTLSEFVEYIEEEYSYELAMLSTDVTILYSDFMPPKKRNERLNMKMKELVETVCKTTLPSSQKYIIFEMCPMDMDSGDDLEVPYVRFRI